LTVQESKRQPAQEEIENQAFDQDKFEATGLRLKAKYGTITPVEQAKLGMLQAKMDSFWAKRMERAKAKPNLLEILIRNAQPAPQVNDTISTQPTEGQLAQLQGGPNAGLQVKPSLPSLQRSPQRWSQQQQTTSTKISSPSGEGNLAIQESHVIQRAHFESGEPQYMDDNDSNSELLDDNFDETIKNQLNQPTSDATVDGAVTAGSDLDVVLWRSTTGASVAAILAASSAGGEPADPNVQAPGIDVQQSQIAIGGVAPEFTASADVTGFSFRHWLVVVNINTRYLARGSGSESGWICSPHAPVVVLDTVDRTMGLPEPPGFGAA
jgi:hypothetical protein